MIQHILQNNLKIGMVGSKEYLSPGEKVSDPNNYGNGYWLYIFKTEFGDLLKIGKES